MILCTNKWISGSNRGNLSSNLWSERTYSTKLILGLLGVSRLEGIRVNSY